MNLILKTLFIFLYILVSIVMAGVVGILFHLPDTLPMYLLLLGIFLLLPIFPKLLKNRS
jgi:hypothetical protein